MKLTKEYGFNDVKIINIQYPFVAWIPMKSNTKCIKKKIITAPYKSTIKEILFEEKFELDWSLCDPCDLGHDDRFDNVKRHEDFKI